MALDTLYWEITDKCPLSCKHCYQGRGANSSRVILSLKESLRRVDVFARNGIKILLLTGGEPLTNKNIHEIVGHSRSYGLDTAILTSGYLITKKVAERIARASPNAVQISFDGVGEVHDSIRGEGVFRRVEDAMKNLTEQGVYYYLKMTLNKLNLSGVLDAVKYCHAKDVLLNFSNAMPIGSTQERNIALSPQEYFDVFVMLHKKKYREGIKMTLPDFALEEYLNGEEVKTMCSAGRRIAALTFGDLFLPCPFIAGLGLTESEGVLSYSDDVINESEKDDLFNVLRKHNETGFGCPLRKFSGGGKDIYSLESFIEHTGGGYESLQKQSQIL
ncbi:MAG: radical SAM protein [Nanoarchaeota archaeon]|nr:radical SAM protein [Nanoarchaeota archaeon]